MSTEAAWLRVQGVLETSLYVSDLDRSEVFYSDLFGFERMAGDERMRALQVPEQQVLLLFLQGASADWVDIDGTAIPGHDGSGTTHLAFKVEETDLDRCKQTLAGAGIEVESLIEWSEGGTSLYFRDPDGHVLELATRGCWPNW